MRRRAFSPPFADRVNRCNDMLSGMGRIYPSQIAAEFGPEVPIVPDRSQVQGSLGRKSIMARFGLYPTGPTNAFVF